MNPTNIFSNTEVVDFKMQPYANISFSLELPGHYQGNIQDFLKIMIQFLVFLNWANPIISSPFIILTPRTINNPSHFYIPVQLD